MNKKAARRKIKEKLKIVRAAQASQGRKNPIPPTRVIPNKKKKITDQLIKQEIENGIN